MTRTQVIGFDRLEPRFCRRPWPFAQQRRLQIDAHFDLCANATRICGTAASSSCTTLRSPLTSSVATIWRPISPAFWHGEIGIFRIVRFAIALAWRRCGGPMGGCPRCYGRPNGQRREGALCRRDGHRYAQGAQRPGASRRAARPDFCSSWRARHSPSSPISASLTVPVISTHRCQRSYPLS
jgi:hypothetical protein